MWREATCALVLVLGVLSWLGLAADEPEDVDAPLGVAMFYVLPVEWTFDDSGDIPGAVGVTSVEIRDDTVIRAMLHNGTDVIAPRLEVEVAAGDQDAIEVYECTIGGVEVELTPEDIGAFGCLLFAFESESDTEQAQDPQHLRPESLIERVLPNWQLMLAGIPDPTEYICLHVEGVFPEVESCPVQGYLGTTYRVTSASGFVYEWRSGSWHTVETDPEMVRRLQMRSASIELTGLVTGEFWITVNF